MSRIRLDTLRDFARRGFHLRVECGACGHVVIADPIVLSMEIRGSKDVAAVEQRMRCLECGERKASIKAEPLAEKKPPKWVISIEGRDGQGTAG